MTWEQAAAVPRAEVLDQGNRYNMGNPGGLTLRQLADDYGAQDQNPIERVIQIREFSEGWQSGWETYTIHAPPPAPLEHLEWNQGGWPAWNGTDFVVVIEADGTSYNAANPENWDFARAAQDFFESFACENKDPHTVQIRTHTINGPGQPQPIDLPVEEPEP